MSFRGETGTVMCSQKLEAKPIRKTAEYKRKVSKILRGKILKVGGADGIVSTL